MLMDIVLAWLFCYYVTEFWQRMRLMLSSWTALRQATWSYTVIAAWVLIVVQEWRSSTASPSRLREWLHRVSVIVCEIHRLSVKIHGCCLCLQAAWTRLVDVHWSAVRSFDQLVLLHSKLVEIGDFNVPGGNAEQLNIVSLTYSACLTCVSMLELQLTSVAMYWIWPSRRMVMQCLCSRSDSPTTTFWCHRLWWRMYSYQLLHRMDTAAFWHNIHQPKRILSTDADEYAEHSNVRRVLDLHVPLPTSRRQYVQHNKCGLSEEVQQTNRLRC